jgi:hypothetical protein
MHQVGRKQEFPSQLWYLYVGLSIRGVTSLKETFFVQTSALCDLAQFPVISCFSDQTHKSSVA